MRVLVCGVGALLGGAWLLLYLFPSWQLANPALALVASFIPLGVFAWALVTVLVLTFRGARVRWLALLSAAALIAQLVWARPYWPRFEAASRAPEVTVMTLNTRFGHADPQQVIDEVSRRRPDVLILIEITGRLRPVLDSAALLELYPFRSGNPGLDDDAVHTMVLSRFGLTPRSASWTDESNWLIDVEGSPTRFTLLAVHPPNPTDNVGSWNECLDRIRNTAGSLAGPVIVAGDFNAVSEHLPMRRLAAAGLADAGQQAGAGWQPSYPSNSLLPPLISIDHVLVNQRLRGTIGATFHVSGTDHRGLFVGLVSQ